MPFRAMAPFLRKNMTKLIIIISVSMPSRASTPFLLRWLQFVTIVNIGVSMPLRAETTFLPEAAKVWKNYKALVSMPFRADAAFLRGEWENLGRGIFQSINALSG